LFQQIFARVGPELEDWSRAAAKTDPGGGAEFVLKVAEFYVPKLQRLNIDLTKVAIEDIAAELARREAEGVT